MSISINATPVSGGSLTVSAVDASGVSVTANSSGASSVNLAVGGGIGPPGAGNVALAAGDGILITSTANVATINCTVEGVPESVLENLSNVLSGNATTGDVLAWNGTTWAANSNYATLTYVDNAVANLVDAAPGALDTLNELAAAIGDDANFSSTITTSLASKAAANHTHTFQEITNGTATVTGNLTLDASTGGVIISGGTSSGSLTLNCENNTHGVTIQSPAHSENATYTLTLPSSAGSANQVLTTDGNGSLSWSNGSSGGGSGVTTLNTLSGDLTLAAGDNVTLSTNGSTLTFSSSGGVSSLDMGTYPRGPGSLLTEGGDTLTSESGDQLLPEQATAAASAVLQLLRSNVAAAVPGSLAEGELAINTEDEVLFYANAAGSVQSFTLGGYAAANHTHTSGDITDFAAAASANAPLQAVNNLTGSLTLAEGSGMTITESGSTITFAASTGSAYGTALLFG